MKFFADESIENEVVARLREEGYEVQHVREIKPGIPDEEVLRLAQASGSVLLTHDKDFGALVFQRKSLTSGVVLCRLPSLRAAQKAVLLVDVIRAYSAELLAAFSVLTDDEFRIRKL